MDPEVVALAEDQTVQTETASAAAVEIETVREDGQTERTEIREKAETERTEIMADAMVQAAKAEAETGVDEEWLRSQFDALDRRQLASEAATLALTEAVTALAQTLAGTPLIPTPLEPLEAPPPPSPPEPTAEPAPEPAASVVKTRRTVLF